MAANPIPTPTRVTAPGRSPVARAKATGTAAESTPVVGATTDIGPRAERGDEGEPAGEAEQAAGGAPQHVGGGRIGRAHHHQEDDGDGQAHHVHHRSHLDRRRRPAGGATEEVAGSEGERRPERQQLGHGLAVGGTLHTDRHTDRHPDRPAGRAGTDRSPRA